VNPVSKNIYMSVSRGRGPDATAVILRVDAAGKISEVPLDNIAHSSVKFVDPPAASTNGRQVETVTAIAYIDGNVVVAGLSNEEFFPPRCAPSRSRSPAREGRGHPDLSRVARAF